jgi:hypothetical protein
MTLQNFTSERLKNLVVDKIEINLRTLHCNWRQNVDEINFRDANFRD